MSCARASVVANTDPQDGQEMAHSASAIGRLPLSKGLERLTSERQRLLWVVLVEGRQRGQSPRHEPLGLGEQARVVLVLGRPRGALLDRYLFARRIGSRAACVVHRALIPAK